jgi:hypothetical protein
VTLVAEGAQSACKETLIFTRIGKVASFGVVHRLSNTCRNDEFRQWSLSFNSFKSLNY